eukprot:CAMPEP_0170176922 /NCGR_PEP_ID=MMETSP0040_2-20121228/9675_1 /TAXON_ID=641309 /ORGANISM="Lotharella oceanica, Strain CCMP622" /LENGTH=119 /DNA_ID=CAMNT_0010419389 /DNA_START=29 /DNA_END=388 /DNA_ORIENTATION=+
MASQPPPGSVIGDRIAELENSIQKLRSSNEYMLECPEFKEDKDLQDAVKENKEVIAKRIKLVEELREELKPHERRSSKKKIEDLENTVAQSNPPKMARKEDAKGAGTNDGSSNNQGFLL